MAVFFLNDNDWRTKNIKSEFQQKFKNSAHIPHPSIRPSFFIDIQFYYLIFFSFKVEPFPSLKRKLSINQTENNGSPVIISLLKKKSSPTANAEPEANDCSALTPPETSGVISLSDHSDRQWSAAMLRNLSNK